MTDDQQWQRLLTTLRTEQGAGAAEGSLHIGEHDTAEVCAERRRVLEAETLRYQHDRRMARLAS